MFIFFDTEFEGLKKDAKLISIGMESESGDQFYAEFTDFDIDNQEDWIKENVLANTVTYGNKNVLDIVENEKDFHTGSKEDIKQALAEWLSQFDEVEFVSDVCHYDFVFLIDIFGSAFDLPDNVCPFCHDITQDIKDYFWLSGKEAFDANREDLLESLGECVEGDKHNSMYDAKVIKRIFTINRS